jgi:hypothetical protein
VISESDWSAKASSRFMARGAGDEMPPPLPLPPPEEAIMEIQRRSPAVGLDWIGFA